MLVKRGKTYFARFQYGGRETWISTHQTAERAARRVHDRLESEFKQKSMAKQIADAMIAQAKMIAMKRLTPDDCRGALAALEAVAYREAFELVQKLIPAPALTAADLWDKYMSTAPNLKESTLHTKRQRFAKFMEWAGDTDCREMTEFRCRKFLDSLGCGDLTKNHYISELSSVWKASPEFLNPWGDHLRNSVVVQHKQPFSLDQIRAIVEYCRIHGHQFWYFAVQIAYYMGGRRLKEVVFFNASSVADGYSDLLPNKTERNQTRVRVKILPQLQTILNELTPDQDGNFFPDMIAKYKRDRANVNREFMSILEKMKLHVPGDGYGFHSIRHTYITEGIDAGIDVKSM